MSDDNPIQPNHTGEYETYLECTSAVSRHEKLDG